MNINLIDPGHSEVLELLRQSDEYMASLYPPESNHMESLEGLRRPNVGFYGAIIDGEVVGCGAVKVMADSETYGEIKRIFVKDAYRRQSVALALMTRLEQHLQSLGVALVRLEVGISQPAALKLYQGLGFTQREPFGAYQPNPFSVFMEKRIEQDKSPGI